MKFVSILAASAAAIGLLVFLMVWNGDQTTASRPGNRLTFYCAAGMREPVEEIVKLYDEEFGVKVDVNYAGSGQLKATLEAADNGDLYLAADESYIENGKREGLFDEVMPIATQKPVLIVQAGNPKQIESIQDVIEQIDDLRIVLPKPEVAAIGRVAQRQLPAELWSQLAEAAITTRDTVNAVANDVNDQFADVGIVWDATAAQYEGLEAISIPELDAAQAEIAVTVIDHSQQPTQALHFARFLTASDRGLPVFEKFGYSIIPDGDEWADVPEITVFAGGLNRLAVEDMIEQFERHEGVKVLDTYNGCGVLVGQMKAGAQPDMYFACDVSFMKMVRDRFYDSVNVSQTAMVIIVPKGNPHEIHGLADLTQEELRVGITNPEHSALGYLSQQLLMKHGLWEDIQQNFHDLPSTADLLVSQVVLGALDAAIVYQANTVEQTDKLTVIEIDDPEAFAVQPIAIARDSKHKYLTQRLIQRIRAVQSEALFEELGFKWLNDPTVIIPMHDNP